MFSIVLGKVEVEAQELEVERLLPKLLDQRMAKIPFVTENGYALEVIMKWRHDETHLKFVEISKRISKIRQVIEKYDKRIRDLQKLLVERDLLVAAVSRSVALENATPCFAHTQPHGKRVYARQSRSPSRYTSALSQRHDFSDNASEMRLFSPHSQKKSMGSSNYASVKTPDRGLPTFANQHILLAN